MTRDEATTAIQKAIDEAVAAYWSACDTECRAIDPADLHAPKGLLEDAYDMALMVQDIATDCGMSWMDARENVYQKAS